MPLTKKQIKDRGTRFETEYSLSLKQLPNSISYRMKNGYAADEFDYLTLLSWGNIAAETKRCGHQFGFTNISDKQLFGLIEFQKKLPTNIGIVPINFKSLPGDGAFNELFIIPVTDLAKYMLTARHQYLALETCRSGFGVPVKRIRFEKAYGWDLANVWPYDREVGK